MSSFADRRRIFTAAPQDFGPVPVTLDTWAAWSEAADASVGIVLTKPSTRCERPTRPVQVPAIRRPAVVKGGVR